MNKINKMLKSMTPVKWIMSSLWAFTFSMLLIFVGVVSGLNKQAVKNDGSEHWTIKQTEAFKKYAATHELTDIKSPEAIYKEMATKTLEKYRDDDELAKLQSNINAKAKQPMYEYDELKKAKPTKEAQNAINGIAATSLIFFLSLLSSIFITSYIKMKERKGGK